jgi:hypothetical protein
MSKNREKVIKYHFLKCWMRKDKQLLGVFFCWTQIRIRIWIQLIQMHNTACYLCVFFLVR